MNILVIDDDLEVAKALSRLLRRKGHQATMATGGEEALRLLDGLDPDAVLCDHRMPGLTGTDVLYQVKQSRPRALRVLISGHADATNEPGFSRAEVHHFVPKPWDDKELCGMLDAAAARKAHA